jgi:hypothetical protein
MSPPGKNSGLITWPSGDAVARRQVEQRTVVALAQELVVEGLREQLVDQLRRGTAAGAVVHVDAALLEVQRAEVVLLHAATTGMSLNRPYA